MNTAAISGPPPQSSQVRREGNRWLTLHRSFIRKEIRQSAFVLLLGLAAIVVGLTALLGASTSIMPFFSGGAVFGAMWIVLPISIALGLSQSFEFNCRSSLFLLHMPISRKQLILSKLFLGGATLLLLFGLPVLVASFVYSLQSRSAPFYLSMTSDLWRLVLTSSMIYLTAFLCGVLTASWFGTRLLPIAGICLFAIAIQIIPFWWLIAPLLILFVDWMLITTIVYYSETRDYA